MNFLIRLVLTPTPEQFERLVALQVVFAQVCNTLAPVARDNRCWNRVALHHMMYKSLREQFPAMGSQMVCNAIYSVCRASRLVYQHPKSPFNVARWGAARPLPLLRFATNCPVYFDRHTLSIRSGQLSMFTLDGRMRFDLALQPNQVAAFQEHKLREIVLTRRGDEGFELLFNLVQDQGMLLNADAAPGLEINPEDIPDYLMVEDAAA